ncbi:YjjG family noncanonical pyrimidine nucleotidase [Leuconostoc pseudomesenteroides]|uniref:YjjG family noncanonical pyrimidine nucleotidase n=1 Tax=Leuconostoc pseudomesenteroides TaxID=33968 RepID=UPI0032DF2C22
MIKNIIFDLDDTLLDFQRGEYEGVRSILKNAGVPDIEEAFKIYGRVNAAVWQQIESGDAAQPLLNRRFSDTLNQLNIKSDGQQLEQIYREHLNHNFHVIPGATNLLKQLKSNGFRLIVGTNGVAKTQHERLVGSGINNYFDEIFISEEIGYRKPEPQFFETILDNNPDRNISNTVMIGDRLSADIVGANAVGMKSIWYNPHQNQTTSKSAPTYIANDYQDILDLIL